MPTLNANMPKPASRALLIVSCVIAAGIASGCAKTVIVSADQLCQSWKHQTVSKSDKLTQGTAEIMEGNNKARPEWGCEYGQDRAKS